MQFNYELKLQFVTWKIVCNSLMVQSGKVDLRVCTSSIRCEIVQILCTYIQKQRFHPALTMGAEEWTRR